MKRRIAIVFLGAFQALAQPPTFDVASVKPTGPGLTPRGSAMRITPGGFNATFVSVMALISKAYGIPTQFISGGPDWAARDPFDIEAKTEASADEDQVKLMLQALLVDRFQLQVRHETKNLPVSSMIVGRLSPKLTPSKEDGKGTFAWTPVWFSGRNMSMADLASILTRQLGQLVIDKTGLEGEFDFRVDNAPGADPWRKLSDVATTVPSELGLKLETQKGPVATLVIDRVERPSAN